MIDVLPNLKSTFLGWVAQRYLNTKQTLESQLMNLLHFERKGGSGIGSPLIDIVRSLDGYIENDFADYIRDTISGK